MNSLIHCVSLCVVGSMGDTFCDGDTEWRVHLGNEGQGNEWRRFCVPLPGEWVD
jgi:hypothetical protein